MRRLSTGQIKELFARRQIVPAADAEAFWSDFRARAQLMNQDRPVAEPQPSIFMKRWVLATACAGLLALSGGLFLLRSTSGAPERNMTLSVTAGHSAVLMIEDQQSKSTIVWIVDMMAGDDDGGSV